MSKFNFNKELQGRLENMNFYMENIIKKDSTEQLIEIIELLNQISGLNEDNNVIYEKRSPTYEIIHFDKKYKEYNNSNREYQLICSLNEFNMYLKTLDNQKFYYNKILDSMIKALDKIKNDTSLKTKMDNSQQSKFLTTEEGGV